MSTPTLSSTPSLPCPFASGDPVLDLRGEVCPYTFVGARLALEALPLASSLAIAVDHAPAVTNLPRSLRAWGQDVTDVVAADTPSLWWIRVIKRVA